jgi:hypothetical protein
MNRIIQIFIFYFLCSLTLIAKDQFWIIYYRYNVCVCMYIYIFYMCDKARHFIVQFTTFVDDIFSKWQVIQSGRHQRKCSRKMLTTDLHLIEKWREIESLISIRLSRSMLKKKNQQWTKFFSKNRVVQKQNTEAHNTFISLRVFSCDCCQDTHSFKAECIRFSIASFSSRSRFSLIDLVSKLLI